MNRIPQEILPRTTRVVGGEATKVAPPPSTPAIDPQVALPEIGDELRMLEMEIAKLEEKERSRKTPSRHDPEEFNRRFGSSR